MYGEDHTSTATTLNNIGLTYNDMSQYERAVEFYLKARDIWKKKYGENHTSAATSYNNLGLLYMNRGDYDKSLE